jgi:hypothetical protein
MYESGRPEADYLGGLGVGAPPEKRGERREEKRRERREERRERCVSSHTFTTIVRVPCVYYIKCLLVATFGFILSEGLQRPCLANELSNS